MQRGASSTVKIRDEPDMSGGGMVVCIRNSCVSCWFVVSREHARKCTLKPRTVAGIVDCDRIALSTARLVTFLADKRQAS